MSPAEGGGGSIRQVHHRGEKPERIAEGKKAFAGWEGTYFGCRKGERKFGRAVSSDGGGLSSSLGEEEIRAREGESLTGCSIGGVKKKNRKIRSPQTLKPPTGLLGASEGKAIRSREGEGLEWKT